jgi:hypothetical protein
MPPAPATIGKILPAEAEQACFAALDTEPRRIASAHARDRIRGLRRRRRIHLQ